MKKPFGKMLLVLALSVAATATHASDSVTYNVMSIERADGVIEYLQIDPAMVVRFQPSSIFISHPEVSVEYALDEVSMFRFEDRPSTAVYEGNHQSSINELSENERLISITDSQITIGGTDDIIVFDTRGIERLRAASDGSAATLTLASLPKGVYIIICGDITLKITR